MTWKNLRLSMNNIMPVVVVLLMANTRAVSVGLQPLPVPLALVLLGTQARISVVDIRQVLVLQVSSHPLPARSLLAPLRKEDFMGHHLARCLNQVVRQLATSEMINPEQCQQVSRLNKTRALLVECQTQ